MRIGVDVGGTNTDAVLLDGPRVVASVKRPTTQDVSGGIEAAVGALLGDASADAGAVDAVMIGTTHFTNAFVQARGLAPVAAVRIGLPAGRSIPPFASWPAALRGPVEGCSAMLAGGFQFDGRELGALDEDGVRRFADEIATRDLREVAITAVFAQVNAAHEERAAAILRDALPGIGITLSSEVGRTGLLERENAAIMNACLRPLADAVATAFGRALASLGLRCPFFVSQNDGTVMTAERLRRFPVLTFAAGPTNSLRGAYFLTGVADALVADIGGTTTDVGVLVGGFPRQSAMHVDIGGVRTNFRMPDLLSIGLGGGSVVAIEGDNVRVGPRSVGYALPSKAMAFGGDTLTATDLAVAAGYADIGSRDRLAGLDDASVGRGVDVIHAMLTDALDRMKTSPQPVPLVLVGGGAALVDRPLEGVARTHRPGHADVANAVGAALGQVSGDVDLILDGGEGGRAAALDQARERAVAAAVAAGAAPDTVVVVELEDLPLQYLPGGARRIVCRAVGDLASLERVDG